MALLSSIGRKVSNLGTSLGLPEMGISERMGYSPPKATAPTVGPMSYYTPYYTGGPMSTQRGETGARSNVLPFSTGNAGPVGGGGGNYNAPAPSGQTFSDPFADMQSQAQDQARLELDQALGEYDYYAEQARNQLGSLETQKTGALSELQAGLGKSEKEKTRATEEATTATAGAKAKALSTAQDVQRKNRNILRALGILSSSAAGQMLNEPMSEYGTQAGELEQSLLKRKGQVEDWWMERQSEFGRAQADLQSKYQDLVNNIQTDLRFNDRQRVGAVKQAQSALQQRLGEIQASQVAYQQAAKQYNDNILMQIAQVQLYQNPQADVSGILSSLINPQQRTYAGPQASITQTEEQRKKLSGLGAY